MENALSASFYKETIEDFQFAIKQQKELIERYQQMEKDCGINYKETIKQIEEQISSYEKNIESSQERYDTYVKSDAEYENIIENGRNQLHAIKFDSENTYKATVDGAGNYTIQVSPGKYSVIIISEGRQGRGLQVVGKIEATQYVEVKSKETTNVDAKFSL